MKRYRLIDNEKGKESEYSSFTWNLAWKTVYVFGVITGILLVKLFQ